MENSIDFGYILFRASQVGKLMVEARSKLEILSETTKTHLVDIYVQNKYGRQTDICNKYITKGLLVEEDAITLYSRVKRSFFKKNDKHLHNEFVKGTPDLFTGLEITSAETIIDIKSSWDIYTFFRARTRPIDKDYYWQLQTYMALTGATNAKLAYCLVNTPETLITDEKRKLLYRMNVVTEENKDFQQACKELDESMKYDDILLNERVIEFEIARNDQDIEKLYKRVEQCREYLSELSETLNPVSYAN